MHAKHSLSSIAHNTHTMHKQSILFKVLLGHTAQFCITLATSSFHIPKAYMDIQPWNVSKQYCREHAWATAT